MKKIIITFLSLLIPLTTQAKLKVVTSLPDLAALTQEVGGDLVKVRSLARGDQDPHYIEPKPSFASQLNQADLFIHIGLELESGWVPVLLTQSRNPKIQRGQPGHLIAAEGISILEVPQTRVDRSQGDIHPEGNPHYWMDPRNGLIIASHIMKKLSELDGEHASLYQKNYATFEERFQKKIIEWNGRLKKIKGKKIITHHKSFSYFVHWAGLEVRGFVEPKPGIPPTPSHILSLLSLIQRENIPIIITENYYDPQPSRELGKKTGAKVLILPTSVGGEASIKTYTDLFETIIHRLEEAL